MPVFVGVRFAAVPGERMGMLMMRIVPVAMRMDELLMSVRVLMSFSEMQPDPSGHQCRSDPEACGRPCVKGNNCKGGADERCS